MSQLIGLSGIIFSIWFVFSHKPTGFHGLWDLPAAVLVGLMPPCIMMLSHTISDFLVGIKILFQAMFSRQKKEQLEVIDALTRSSAIVRSEGIGALVKEKDKVRNEFLKDGISLIVNDFSVDEIRHNLQAKISAKHSQMMLAANLFENMSKVCPGVGMIGSLMGLIGMLSNMEDPSKIGANMAISLIATFYGLMLGTIIYGPWSEKIALEVEKRHDIDMLVLEGVLNIKGKKSSLHLKSLMKTYGSGNKEVGKGA